MRPTELDRRGFLRMAGAVGSTAVMFDAGALWVALPAWLRLRFGVLEVISTLLLNFVAESLVSWMVQGPLQEAKHIYPQSDPIAAAARRRHAIPPGNPALRTTRVSIPRRWTSASARTTPLRWPFRRRP